VIPSVENPLREDLDYVLRHTSPLFEELRGKSIFITGGTGFIGCWILESLLWANEHLGLNVTATVLTRDWSAFQQRSLCLANSPYLDFVEGDLVAFDFGILRPDFIIHAGCPTSVAQQSADPVYLIDTITIGTRRMLALASRDPACKFLFISSKAAERDYEPETTYGVSKRLAEQLCRAFHDQYAVQAKILRLWAMIGPGLPLDSHFAASSFIRQALERTGQAIEIKGNPYATRAWLYAADMVIEVWRRLFTGEPGVVHTAYGQQQMTIRELAHRVSKQANLLVSDVDEVDEVDEAAAVPGIGIDSAIQRTLKFYGYAG
jgi:nucleoside-diphosphate-sugar epimerase